MKNKFCLFFIFFALYLIPSISMGQTTSKPTSKKVAEPHVQSLNMIAAYYGDSVILRWAPANWQVWQAGIAGGYIVERYELTLPANYLTEKDPKKKKKPVLNEKSKKILTTQALKPMAAEEWKKLFDSGDSTSAIAAQMIYGKKKDAVGTKDVAPGKVLDALNEQQNLLSMGLLVADRSSNVAKGMALSFVDKTIEKNKGYIYKVYIQNTDKSLKLDSTGAIVQTFKSDEIPSMVELKAEEDDKRIVLKWDRFSSSVYFSSYLIERSSDGGKSFSMLTKYAFTPMIDNEDNTSFWSDSIPENYKKYEYRVTGITPFGMKGKPNTIRCMGRDRTAPLFPMNVVATHVSGTKVQITWDKNTTDSDLLGYFVGKGEQLKGPFRPLSNDRLSTATNSYIDENANPNGLNYYVVAAIDTAGNTVASNPAYVIIKDETPPAQPVGVKAIADSTGLVQLTWSIGEDPDLLGYLVYIANDSTHIFSPVSKELIPINAFLDTITLHSLTENVYYKVVALDKHKNVSIPSKIVEVARYDTIAPVQPVFNDFKVSDTLVKIFWNKSTSTDVTSQLLYRKEAEGDWVLLTKLDKSIDKYVDHSVKSKVEYQYAISVVDEAGNASPKSYPLKARPYGKMVDLSETPKVVFYESEHKIEVTWKKNIYPGKMLIYRNYNKNGLVLYKSVDAKDGIFTDKNLNKAGEYEYAIKIQSPDGTMSNLSPITGIKIK